MRAALLPYARLFVAGFRPVSYTHLDVYKRQTIVLTRANQALATLERYKSRLDEVTATLSALEVEDFVTCLLYTSRCV